MNKFTEDAKAKGWPMKAIAKRWGVTPRRMSQIAAEPKKKDWDALSGLPCRKKKRPNVQKSPDSGLKQINLENR